MDISVLSRENEALLSHISGAVKRFEDKGIITQIGFLDELMCRVAEKFFCENSFFEYSFISPRFGASRRFLTVGTTEENAELVYISLRPDKFHSPSHRDYMGALMSLQIDRKLFGDLIVTDNSVGFLAVWDKGDVVSHIFDTFISCGRAKLTLERVSAEKYNLLELQFEKLVATVASLRADCIVAAIANASRSQAKALVERGDFKLFSSPVTDVDYTLREGDVFSVRGYGKYRFDSTVGMTRRDRIRILLMKFGNYIERNTTHDSTS